MNDHETTALRDRMDRLADRMAPEVDVVGLVRDARARNRRQRRGRLTLLAVATATAVAVPVGVTALDGRAPDGRNAAGPGADAEDRRSQADEQARLAAERAQEEGERALQERLAAAGAAVARALEEADPGPTVVSLTAPAGAFPCPADSGAVQAALGGVLLDYRAGALPGDMGACEWSVPGSSSGSLAESFSVGIGFTLGWTEEDLAGLPPEEGCQQTVVQAAEGPGLVVEVCATESYGSWALSALDSSGTGAWWFRATAGTAQPLDGAAALVAAVRVADRTW